MKTTVFTSVLNSNIKTNSIMLILSFGLLMVSCDDDDPMPNPMSVCDTDNSKFSQLVNQQLTSNPDFELAEFMDLAVHSYTFMVDTDKTICKIGYQAQPNLDTDYEIRIIDVTNGNQVIYSGTHSFSSIAITYESVGGVQLSANTEYKIEREYDPGFFDTKNIGKLMRSTNYSNNLTFPMTFGELTITHSSFYGYGGPNDDNYLPYIDLIFEE